jgi:phosphoribosylformimino-5-aminoimidazole carboxamide ribotide isomerase
MVIIPAIDIKGGKVVRLWQGDFDKATVYSESPLEMALFWEREGAQFLHLVDLDGALEGRPKNLELIRQISSVVKVPVQAGGGLRRQEDISDLLSGKVERVVVGTKACGDIVWLKDLADRFKERIIVSLDIKDGFLATDGWTKKSVIKPEEFMEKLKHLGLELFIFTDVNRDGTLAGLNIGYIRDFLARTKARIIIAGGISSLEDIRSLKPLTQLGLAGLIIGRALYEKKFSLKEAMAVAE